MFIEKMEGVGTFAHFSINCSYFIVERPKKKLKVDKMSGNLNSTH